MPRSEVVPTPSSSTHDSVRELARTHAPERAREEEPIGVVCDFGVVYSLFLRPTRRNKGGGAQASPRVILKVTWENLETDSQDDSDDENLRSCTFEVDLERERLVALGRKGNSIPAAKFPAAWFCNWARQLLSGDGKENFISLTSVG